MKAKHDRNPVKHFVKTKCFLPPTPRPRLPVPTYRKITREENTKQSPQKQSHLHPVGTHYHNHFKQLKNHAKNQELTKLSTSLPDPYSRIESIGSPTRRFIITATKLGTTPFQHKTTTAIETQKHKPLFMLDLANSTKRRPRLPHFDPHRP